MIRIDGKKVFLKPFDEQNLNDPKYFAWVTDIEVIKYIGRDEYLKPLRFEKVREYVEGLWCNELCAFFAIYHSQENQFIGTVKINYLNEAGLITRTADIGIMIGAREYWGKGLATDALFATCQYTFNVLGARKLTAGAVAANGGVIKAFLKIGFKEEGRIRKKLLISGEYIDHVLLGCFKDELVSLLE